MMRQQSQLNYINHSPSTYKRLVSYNIRELIFTNFRNFSFPGTTKLFYLPFSYRTKIGNLLTNSDLIFVKDGFLFKGYFNFSRSWLFER